MITNRNMRSGFVLLGFGLGMVLTVDAYSFRRASKPKQMMSASVQTSETSRREHSMRGEEFLQGQQAQFGSGPDLSQPAQNSRWGGVAPQAMPVKQLNQVSTSRNSSRRSLRGGMPHESGRSGGPVQQQHSPNQSISRQEKLSQAKPWDQPMSAIMANSSDFHADSRAAHGSSRVSHGSVEKSPNARRSFRFLNKKPGTNPLFKGTSNHSGGHFQGRAVSSHAKPGNDRASSGFFESFGAQNTGERRGAQRAMVQGSHSRMNSQRPSVQPGFGHPMRGKASRGSHQAPSHPEASSRKAKFHNPNEDLAVKPYRGDFYTQGGRAFAVDPGLLGRWKAAQSSR